MSVAVKNVVQSLPEPGIHGFEETYYHSLPYISRTGLVHFSKSPRHYYHWKNNPSEPTPAMILGTAFHSSVLEPHLFKKKYTSAPEALDKRTKSGKAEWEEFKASNIGKIVLDADEFARVERMTEEVFSHAKASELLTGGQAEQSLIWDSEEHGIRLKGRVDYLRSGKIVIDLKSCYDASPEAFKRSIANLKYHWTGPFYNSALKALTGSELQNVIFIAVENTEPHGIGVFTLDDMFCQAGEVAFKKYLSEFAECHKKDVWPSYSKEIQVLEAPRWLGVSDE